MDRFELIIKRELSGRVLMNNIYVIFRARNTSTQFIK